MSVLSASWRRYGIKSSKTARNWISRFLLVLRGNWSWRHLGPEDQKAQLSQASNLSIGIGNGGVDSSDLPVRDGSTEEREWGCRMAAEGKTQCPEQNVMGRGTTWISSSSLDSLSLGSFPLPWQWASWEKELKAFSNNFPEFSNILGKLVQLFLLYSWGN